MTDWLDNELYARDSTRASDHLAKALFRGELALCLGAGVSRPLGLPAWPELVRDCLRATGLPEGVIGDTTPTSMLQRAAGDVRRKLKDDRRYHQLVAQCLYKGAKHRSLANATPLLTALGAMTMGSRRGRVKELWTLNFDDVIEWYLRINGFVTQVVTEVPTLLRDVDVTIYHPHGFLPLDPRNGTPSERIVFDDTSYADHVFGKDPQMKNATQNIITSKILFAVGLAWGDDTLQDMIRATGSAVTSRPLAFWCFGPAPTPDKVEQLESDKTNCLAHNVVPLQFTDCSELPTFVLSICEKAMAEVSRLG